MSDETSGLVAGLLAVVAALIVFSMIRAAARGHLTKDSGFGLITPAVKKNDATWAAGHTAALVPAKKTIAVTAGVWMVLLIIGLLIGQTWTGYLGLAPYLVVLGGIVVMVRTANEAAVEAAKKKKTSKKRKK